VSFFRIAAQAETLAILPRPILFPAVLNLPFDDRKEAIRWIAVLHD
jgi:hypothetical protein